MNKNIPFLLLLFACSAGAHPPVILKAEAQLKDNQLYDVAVTIRHGDTGWDHYAKEWIIILDGEKQIAKRTLYHPHVNEQPFTRYSRDVLIPIDAERVTIKATCNLGHESSEYVLLNRPKATETKKEKQEANQ